MSSWTPRQRGQGRSGGETLDNERRVSVGEEIKKDKVERKETSGEQIKSKRKKDKGTQKNERKIGIL